MRNSFRAFSIPLTACAGLIALAGPLSPPAFAQGPPPQGDVGQQQARVDELESKAADLRSESEAIGGSRDPRKAIRDAEGRIRDLDDYADRMEKVADEMKASKADIEKWKEDYENAEAADEGSAKNRAEDVVKETLQRVGGEVVKKYTGPAGRIFEVFEEAGKLYFRSSASSTLEEYSQAQAKNAKDAIETSIINRKAADEVREDQRRLKEIDKELKKVENKASAERAKLRRMTGPGFPDRSDRNPVRFTDPAGDQREESKYKAWKGVKTVSFGGGYLEAGAPEQFVGRVVVDGQDFAMLETEDPLDGYYAEFDGELPLDDEPPWGEVASIGFEVDFTDVEGDAFRFLEAAPAVSGFVWIDPLDPTIPFAVGLGGPNLAWNASANSSAQSVFGSALYRGHHVFSGSFAGAFGVGLTAGSSEVEHDTLIRSLDVPDFRVQEGYELSTLALGPRIETSLEWGTGAEGGGAAFAGSIGVFVAPTYDWRELDVTQRATGPFFGGFDHSQRLSFDDNGVNVRYGLEAELGVRFGGGKSVFLKAGLRGEAEAPTVRPAAGSPRPGAPIRPETEGTSDWFVGAGVRFVI